jgi:integrase/recombinase XerC
VAKTSERNSRPRPKQRSGDFELEHTATAFLKYLREVRQLSPHTLSNYHRDLRTLQDYCKSQNNDGLTTLVEADIRAWVSGLHRKGLSGSSIQRSLSAARSFYNYLGRENGRPRNPATAVQAPRQPRRLPKTLDADQVSRYLNFDADDPVTKRDSAMAELFYSSGLRLAELAAVNVGDIDPYTQLLTVTGKGNKTRTVPVGTMALTAVERWMKVRQAGADEPALFTSNRGGRISVRNIQARMKVQGRRSGMHQDVHPHMLRHSFASHMLESSGDLRAVQELLGHANISTTQIYTHLDFQHLAKVYDAAHPRAKRQK